MVRRSSNPRVTHPEVKVQVRDLVRVVDIVAAFAPRVFSIRRKFVLSSPRGQMGTGDLYQVPTAAVHHGRVRQSSGTGPCGYCRRVLWVPRPEVRTTFNYIETTLVLYPGFLDKTNFPPILTLRARFPQDPSTIPTRSRP